MLFEIDKKIYESIVNNALLSFSDESTYGVSQSSLLFQFLSMLCQLNKFICKACQVNFRSFSLNVLIKKTVYFNSVKRSPSELRTD